MGALRLSLALVVVIAHCGTLYGFAPLNGLLAVQTFFMISGFYMGMILTGKYQGPGSYRLFLSNRFLRIYPTYWAVLLFAIAVNALMYRVIGVGPFEAPQKTGFAGLLLLTFSNLFIFGQDVVMYLGTLPKGALFFTANVHTTSPQLWTFLFVPPAWSLSVELMFYVIAPFLLRRATRWILLLMTLSVALRAALFFGLHLTNDPWTGRFFPTEIIFFLAGAIAYRIYLRVQATQLLRSFWPMMAAVFFGSLLTYQFIPNASIFGLSIKQATYYPVAWLAIPFLFALSKQSKLDRFIGELSFPLYLVHYPMLRLLLMGLHHFRLDYLLAPAGVGASLAASVVLTRLVTLPLEKLRQRRLRPADGPSIKTIQTDAVIPAKRLPSVAPRSAA